jgi:hypothetical protein
MDPGTIITVIQIAGKIVKYCQHYIAIAKNAPFEIRSILVEISAIKSLLKNLKILLDSNSASMIHQTLMEQGNPVRGCYNVLSKLDLLFPSDFSKGIGLKTKLVWPLKESKAKELLQELAKHKADINLALTVDSL